MPARPLLVIEDNDEDVAVLLRILAEIGFTQPIVHLHSAEQALEQLTKEKLTPAVILLDLNLPGLDGRGFLYQIKQTERLKSIPVVVLSSSDNALDVDFCFRHGVAGYLIKVMDLAEQARVMRSLVNYWFESTLLPPTVRSP
jgi:CheY-like chemotaxis protein